MISLDRLRTLHVVATHGSLHRAAEVLNVSASAVSQQIAKLEREVGETLLEKRGRGVSLTDAAGVLVGHAERAISALREAEAELNVRRSVVSGELSVGLFATAVRGLAPRALRRLAASYPHLDVELQEVEPDVSLRLAARGTLDLVVAVDWIGAPLPIPEGLERAPLLQDVADIALPADHPLARRRGGGGRGASRARAADTVGPIDLADLAGESWITFPTRSICHDWLKLTLRGQGREPKIRFTAVEIPTQLELVGAGLGVSVLPRLGRTAIPEGVRIVEVRPSLTRQVYALWRRDATRRPAILAAVEALCDAGREATVGERSGAVAGVRERRRTA
jgi:DNA-binding transcriptional LysR family regulator